jgi:hypothetical protein
MTTHTQGEVLEDDFSDGVVVVVVDSEEVVDCSVVVGGDEVVGGAAVVAGGAVVGATVVGATVVGALVVGAIVVGATVLDGVVCATAVPADQAVRPARHVSVANAAVAARRLTGALSAVFLTPSFSSPRRC